MTRYLEMLARSAQIAGLCCAVSFAPPLAADDNPWKPTSETLDELVRDGYRIVNTNVVVPAAGGGITVEVIYLQADVRVYRCLTRHVEGSDSAQHRCDRLKRW
jgi:hypothetical protein